jgi:mono/diheme cytochrome c family protein
MMKRVTLGAVLLLLSLSVAELIHARPDRTRDSHTSSGARHGGQARGDARVGLQAKQVATDEERGRLLATGKKIFVERCAKCHDERGDKPLKTGPPLSQRELSDEEIARAVSGRLKNAPDEEKRAVAVYVSSFIKRK